MFVNSQVVSFWHWILRTTLKAPPGGWAMEHQYILWLQFWNRNEVDSSLARFLWYWYILVRDWLIDPGLTLRFGSWIRTMYTIIILHQAANHSPEKLSFSKYGKSLRRCKTTLIKSGKFVRWKEKCGQIWYLNLWKVFPHIIGFQTQNHFLLKCLIIPRLQIPKNT